MFESLRPDRIIKDLAAGNPAALFFSLYLVHDESTDSFFEAVIRTMNLRDSSIPLRPPRREVQALIDGLWRQLSLTAIGSPT